MAARPQRLEIRVKAVDHDDLMVSLGRGAKEVWIDTALVEDAEPFIEKLAQLLGEGASAYGIYTPAPIIRQPDMAGCTCAAGATRASCPVHGDRTNQDLTRR